MKKIITFLLVVFILTGCTDMMNTPTKRVEEFLGKYQTMDTEVLTQLDDILETEGTMTDEQKKEYKDIMKKQYQNLSYKIKDETVDGDDATVEVEIEVYDYHSAISEIEEELDKNQEAFLDENNNLDIEKFMNAKLEQLNNVKEKIKYTLYIDVHKKDDKWVMDNISETDLKKLHGLYDY